MKSRISAMWVKERFAVTQCRAIRNAALALGLVVCILPLAPFARAQDAKIITFDAPGAVGGTFALAINPAGMVTGFFFDANSFGHGFLRASGGTFTTFDAPGAGTGSILATAPSAISATGEITGIFAGADFVAHGFVRAADGTFTTFDAPGAIASGIGTFPASINPEGVVTGSFFDANLVSHGFVRASNGVITTFDDPNASTGLFEGTNPVALDPQGAVVGCYSNSLGVGVGFLRTPGGTFSTLNPSGSPEGFTTGAVCGGVIFSLSLVQGMAINPLGVIAGTYFLPIAGDIFGGNYRGFVRALDGSFTTFDAVPSPTSPCCTWTFPSSINPMGEVTGYENDFTGTDHGFLRAPNGSITVFDVPSARGTVAASINPLGVIAGFFFANGTHGFLRIP